MSTVLSIVAIAALLVLMAVSLKRQRQIRVEEEVAHDRQRDAPGQAQQERLLRRRAHVADDAPVASSPDPAEGAEPPPQPARTL